MNLKCLINGHDLEKNREIFEDDYIEGFISSNHGTSVTQYGYDVHICKRCLKEKKILNGKKRIR